MTVWMQAAALLIFDILMLALLLTVTIVPLGLAEPFTYRQVRSAV